MLIYIHNIFIYNNIYNYNRIDYDIYKWNFDFGMVMIHNNIENHWNRWNKYI